MKELLHQSQAGDLAMEELPRQSQASDVVMEELHQRSQANDLAQPSIENNEDASVGVLTHQDSVEARLARGLPTAPQLPTTARKPIRPPQSIPDSNSESPQSDMNMSSSPDRRPVSFADERQTIVQFQDKYRDSEDGIVQAACEMCFMALEHADATSSDPNAFRLQPDEPNAFDFGVPITIDGVIRTLDGRWATDELSNYAAVHLNSTASVQADHYVARPSGIARFVQRLHFIPGSGPDAGFRPATIDQSVARLRLALSEAREHLDSPSDTYLPLFDMPISTESISLIYNVTGTHYVHVELIPTPPGGGRGIIRIRDSARDESMTSDRRQRLNAEMPLFAELITMNRNMGWQGVKWDDPVWPSHIQQSNGADCGFFAYGTARALSRGRPLPMRLPGLSDDQSFGRRMGQTFRAQLAESLLDRVFGAAYDETSQEDPSNVRQFFETQMVVLPSSQPHSSAVQEAETEKATRPAMARPHTSCHQCVQLGLQCDGRMPCDQCKAVRRTCANVQIPSDESAGIPPEREIDDDRLGDSGDDDRRGDDDDDGDDFDYFDDLMRKNREAQKNRDRQARQDLQSTSDRIHQAGREAGRVGPGHTRGDHPTSTGSSAAVDVPAEVKRRRLTPSTFSSLSSPLATVCDFLRHASTPQTGSRIVEAVEQIFGSEIYGNVTLTVVVFWLDKLKDTFHVEEEGANALSRTYSLRHGAGHSFDTETLGSLFCFGRHQEVPQPPKSDNIEIEYRLIISMARMSSTASEFQLDWLQKRAGELMLAHHSVFSPSAAVPIQVSDGHLDPVPALLVAQNQAMWINYSIGNYQSTRTIFEAQKAARIHAILAALNNEAKAHHVEGEQVQRLRVLLLTCGLDGLTSNNRSWQHLMDQYPYLEFRVTIATSRDRLPDAASGYGRSAVSGGAVWLSYEVSKLAQIFRGMRQVHLSHTQGISDPAAAEIHAHAAFLTVLLFINSHKLLRQRMPTPTAAAASGCFVHRATARFIRSGRNSRNQFDLGRTTLTPCESLDCDAHEDQGVGSLRRYRGSLDLSIRCSAHVQPPASSQTPTVLTWSEFPLRFSDEPRNAPQRPRDAPQPPRNAPQRPRDAPQPPRDAPQPPRDASPLPRAALPRPHWSRAEVTRFLSAWTDFVATKPTNPKRKLQNLYTFWSAGWMLAQIGKQRYDWPFTRSQNAVYGFIKALRDKALKKGISEDLAVLEWAVSELLTDDGQ